MIQHEGSFRHSLTILVGMGSISHNFDGTLAISVFTDSNERVSNLDKGVPANVVDLAG